jgi:glycosyltransferase involved in cell wall biosynthesis
MNKQETLRIVILYAELVGYIIGMLKELVRCYNNVKIDIVCWDKKHSNSTRFIISSIDNVEFYSRSSLSDSDLLELLRSKSPDIIFVSGWMDKGYLNAIRKYKKEGGSAQVVCGLDNQWEGTLRQHIGRFYFKLNYTKLFDFMWVAGKPQYEFAHRIGYSPERIIYNLLSADTAIFYNKSSFLKRFVFVGRFDPVKALDQLLDAYYLLPAEIRDEWPLVLIGDGQFRREIEIKRSKNIVVKPYMQPEELRAELMKGGVACFPSYHEQWGVAIHEMAIMGFPLVLSSACGAASEFLISGYNGFLFRKNNKQSLFNALLKIATIDDNQLEIYSQRSHLLGMRISSEHAAYSLLSVIQLSNI